MTNQLMFAGIVVFGVGILILLAGKRPEVSISELIAMGRSIYDDLESVFKGPNVVYFKILSYSGMGIILLGITLMLLEILE